MQRVYWLLDEVFAKTHPRNWDAVTDLTSELITLIASRDLEHQVINPLHSFRKAVGRLVETSAYEGIRTIVDISGWVGDGLKPLFPEVEIYRQLSLSRVLDVSTPDFRRVGYVMNISQDETKRRAIGLDLSNVLIVDDTGITGKTSQLVMKALGINPKNTAYLFLFANLGDFPTPVNEPIRPGAVTFLEGLGSKVIYGDAMTTPIDDAEHIRDIFNHPSIETGFSVALRLRNHIRTSQYYRDQLHSFLSGSNFRRDLFPQQLEQADIMQLSAEGRFMRNPSYKAPENAIYSRNPLLWTFNDFWNKLDEPSLQSRQEDILGLDSSC